MKHRADAIEERVAREDLGGCDVAPGDRDAEPGASLAGRAERSGEASAAIAPGAARRLADVESDGAESPAKLVLKVAVKATNGGNKRAQSTDCLEGQIENKER